MIKDFGKQNQKFEKGEGGEICLQNRFKNLRMVREG